MTYNAYEQVQNQKEVARLQRRRHRADTSRDDAEERHEAISDYVVAARHWVPLITAIIFGGLFTTDAGGAWMATLICVGVTMIVANVLGRMMGGMLGRFRRHIQINTENLWFTIGGVLTALLGAGTQAPGMTIAGIVLALTPFVWTRWGRQIMRNTDFARMQSEPDEPAPRIVE